MMNKIRCLVVDDAPWAVETTARYLKAYPQVSAQFTSDDKQAMHIIKEQPLDLLFTDLQMPNFSGLDLLAALEEKGSGRAYLLTGSQIEKKDVQSSVLLDVLYKPLSQGRFNQALEAYLALHRSL